MSEETRPAITDLVQQRIQGKQELEALVVRKDETGTSLVITPELHAKFNVLAPAMVVRQQTPHFVPGLELVQLDSSDFYAIEKMNAGTYENPKWVPKTLALDKNGLRKLKDAVGIDFPSERNVGVWGAREEFTVEMEGSSKKKTVGFRTYTYHAVGQMRRPDGTVDSFPAEVDFDPQIALLEAEAEVESKIKNWKKKPGADEKFNMVLERFIQLAKFAAPTIKSKAQSAVIRDALKVPQKMDPADALKPFLLVRYNFVPEDTVSGRALMSAVFGTSSPDDALYGAQGSSHALPGASTFEVDQAGEDAIIPDEVEGEFTILPDGREVNEGTGEYHDVVEQDEPSDRRSEALDMLAALSDYKLTFTNEAGKNLGTVVREKGIAWFDAAINYWEGGAKSDQSKVDAADDFQAIAEFYAAYTTVDKLGGIPNG